MIKASPLKDKYIRKYIKCNIHKDYCPNFCYKDVQSAVEWLKLQLPVYLDFRTKMFRKLIDKAFADVIEKKP